MKKTPEDVSRTRQKLSREIETWRAGIRDARLSLALDSTSQTQVKQRIAFGTAQLRRCIKEMRSLNKVSKRHFWPKASMSS